MYADLSMWWYTGFSYDIDTCPHVGMYQCNCRKPNKKQKLNALKRLSINISNVIDELENL